MTTTAPLQNIYYERKVATPKPCYICKRPTATVLATIKTEDFLYTCDGHLNDPASPIAPPAPPAAAGPSPEDVKKVIAEHKAKEARKVDAKDKDKDTDADKDKEKDKSKEKSKDKDKKGNEGSTPNVPVVAPTPPPPTHRKFALHRQVFDMRKAELKRKELGVKAKEVGKGLPQVPRGAF